VTVLMSWIDARSWSIGRFQWSCCWLSMASIYVNGLLLTDVDASAFTKMISMFVDVSTWLLVIQSVRGGG